MNLRLICTVFFISLTCGAIGFGVCWFLLKFSDRNSVSVINKNVSTNLTSNNFTANDVDDIKLPWLVLINKKTDENQTKFLCGGSLIGRNHVLAGND